MMKKVLALVLTLAVVQVQLTACGSGQTTQEKQENTVQSSQQTQIEKSESQVQSQQQQVKESQSEKTESQSEKSESQVQSQQQQVKESQSQGMPTISEKVLVDEAGVKITAKQLDFDNIFGPEVKLLIENNSGKNLTFQARDVSINGYMVEPVMSQDVLSGKKVNDDMMFMSSDLESSGITDIANIEVQFHIFDTDSWEDYLNTDKIQIDTSLAGEFKQTKNDSGLLAYEGNDIKIRVIELTEDSLFGPSIQISVENSGNRNVTVQVGSMSVNGFMVDPICSCEVGAGKNAVSDITIMTQDLEDNAITSIDDVEVSFHIFDTDSWDTIVDTDAVNVTF